MSDRTSIFWLWLKYAKQSLRTRTSLPDPAGNLIKLAMECYDAGHQGLSVLCLRRAAAVAKNPGTVYSRLGQLYYDRADYAQACDAFKQAITTDSRSLQALRGLAMSSQMLADYEQAIYYYISALAVEPKDFDSLINLGIIYHSQGRIENAVELFRQAVGLDENSEFAQFALGRALHDNSEFGEAEAALKAAIELDSGRGESYLYLGLVQEAVGRTEDAIESYRRAVAADPKDVESEIQLSRILLRTDLDDAMKHALAALRNSSGPGLEPDRARAYWQIGWIYYLKHEWKESIEASRSGLALDPKLAQVRFNLGLALLRAGRTEEARRVYVEALDSLTDAWDLETGAIPDLENALHEDPNIEGAASILQLLKAKRHELLAGIKASSDVKDK